jgi:inner membrane protein
MKWVNHVAIAGSVTAVWRPELVPLAVLGSTAPDWMEWAYTGVTGRKINHRGATHYVASWLAGLAFGLWVWDWHYLIAAFSAGGLSHVLCDALTAKGVPFWWWSDRKFHLFGGRLKTGMMGEYFVAGAVVVACVGLALLTRHWGGGEFSPFFFDWADYYKSGVIDAKEWKENRFRWL